MMTKNVAPDVDAAAERVRELSEQMITQAKQGGLSWLEAYEKGLENLLRLQQQAGAGHHCRVGRESRRRPGRLRPGDHQGLSRRRA